MYQVSQQVLDRNLIAKCYEMRKNSLKFVYILAKECRSHFNLTNIFDRKKFKILISHRFEIIHYNFSSKTCWDTLYQVSQQVVNSLGTLGIITSASLKLYARPEIQSAALTSFRSVEDAIKTVVEIFQHSVPMARIEFMDKLSMQICNAYSKTDYVEEPTLFLEFHGSSLAVEEQIRTVKDICRSHSGSQLKYAHNANERKRLWQARHDMHWAIRDYKPNYAYHGTDICVPISKLPEAINFSQKYFQKIGVDAPVMGHVGDGNLHCNIYYDPNDHHFNHVQAAEMLALNAIKLGGTCTGEHGIGLGKKKLLAQQFGFSGINTMKMIKGVLDPLNIMNPGKIL